MFARLATVCHDRRRTVLAVWIGVLVLAGILSSAVGNGFRDEFNLPDVESRAGFDVLEEHFGGAGTGETGTIVFRAEQGVDDPTVQAEMSELFAEVRRLEDVLRVQSPYEPGVEGQISAFGPLAGQVAYANVEVPDDIDLPRAGVIRDAIREAQPEVEGLQVELGGFIFAEFEEPKSEVIGLAFAIVILILAFGSVLAMGLPVGVALFGIGIGTAIITLMSNVVAIPDFSTFLGIMIGLGVGIDYALLIVTRYREQHHNGHDVRESIQIALDTAGRAVLFAGMTVVISLLGMLLMGVSFVNGLAIGAASVVLVTVAASLTLLPALLAVAGERVERTRWRGLLAAGFVAIALVGVGFEFTPLMVGLPIAAVVLVTGFFVGPLKREVPHRTPKPLRETPAYRWSRFVQHRPWPVAIGAAVALLVMSVPLLGLHLGFSDESNYPEETTTRQAFELLAAGFGPGFNGPMILAAEVGDATEADLEAVTEAARSTAGVAFVSPAVPSPDGQAALWHLVPATGPQDAETRATVNRLRDDTLPRVEQAIGADVNVTGMPAVSLDFSDYLSSRYPYFFGAVLLLSFLLLMMVFRSLLVPLKAVVMNLLSIGAAYGVVVALFQWGWLSGITGVQPAPIETWAPMMLFAIVFGLSMDYEVFLLSRIREEWRRTGDTQTSVADGLAATAKVITAAAAIMVVVFGSFILESDRILKLMGTGLAVAILLDATVVRMLLVPATMELLGERNWWLPRWLDRLLPSIEVEGPATTTEEPELEPAAQQ
ncbi:MAG: MMPL family transporter [Actinobacteria bacterium]|nr:MMPL family transporter [Actinomycetota bacterium]